MSKATNTQPLSANNFRPLFKSLLVTLWWTKYHLKSDTVQTIHFWNIWRAAGCLLVLCCHSTWNLKTSSEQNKNQFRPDWSRKGKPRCSWPSTALQMCFWWTAQIHLSPWSNTSWKQLVTWKTTSDQTMAMLIEVDVHTLARLQEVRATLYVQSYMFVLWYSKILLSKKLLRAAWVSSKVWMRERCGTHCLLSSWESWRRFFLSFSIGLYLLRTEQRPVEANRGQVRHVRLLEFSAFPILLYSCGLTKENVLKGR